MKLILILVFTFSSILAFSQGRSKIIYWSESYKLNWMDFEGSDFQENGNSQSGQRARSSVGILKKIKVGDDTVSFSYTAAFDQTNSSVKADSKSLLILEHEQLHFDMTELLCRKIRKTVSEMKPGNQQESKQLHKSIKALTRRYVGEQQLYDRESYTSIQKQLNWQFNVSQQLKDLEDFKDPVIKIARIK